MKRKPKKPFLVKALFTITLLTVASFILSAILNKSDTAQALSSWTAGKIMDDAVLTNKASMSASQIQSFLNSKVPNCDTNGTAPASDFGRPDLTHAQYAALRGWHGPPYICLKNYSQDGKSAAQIIYDTAQEFSINPQVLIVLLQKEQSLVTDTWPLNGQYRTATGYGCPDTAPCDSEYFGFTNQVRWAARMFRAIMNNSPTWYTPYILGNNYIQYNPNSSCGGSTVFIQNRATQALYNYTPYQPNQATLDAGWGTAPCGAYGNRNFYLYFKTWFGDPRLAIVSPIAERYYTNTWLGQPLINQVCTLRDAGCYQLFANGAIYWSSATGAQFIRGGIKDKWVSFGFENGTFGYPTSGELAATGGGAYQTFQGGIINWTSVSTAHGFTSNIFAKWNELGSEKGFFGRPLTDSICGLKNSGCYQLFSRGTIYWTTGTGAQSIHGGIKNKWVSSGFENGALGYPTSGELAAADGGVYQTFQGGTIYWSTKAGAVRFNNNLYSAWTASGASSGLLGKPTTDSICGLKNNGCYQLFEKRTLYWTAETGAQYVHGGIKNKWLSVGLENGALGYPTSGEIPAGDGVYQTFQGGTINWTPSSGASIVYN